MAHTEERISKILSAYGVCSRRAAEELLRTGRITVNGAAAELGQKADPDCDVLCVDGTPLQTRPEGIYIMLHKPRGYVTTASDERGRRSVLELTADCGGRVWPVGRLDMDSEGLLLLTNDGDLTQRLIHPRHEVRKIYTVRIAGDSAAAAARLRSMDSLEGERICRPQVRVLRAGEGQGVLSIAIHEGKNRQVRRMCAAAGCKVLRLKRVQEGAVKLGNLPVGAWRYLTAEEIRRLKEA